LLLWKPKWGTIAAAVLEGLVEASAAKYAQEKGTTPRDCP